MRRQAPNLIWTMKYFDYTSLSAVQIKPLCFIRWKEIEHNVKGRSRGSTGQGVVCNGLWELQWAAVCPHSQWGEAQWAPLSPAPTPTWASSVLRVDHQPVLQFVKNSTFQTIKFTKWYIPFIGVTFWILWKSTLLELRASLTKHHLQK